MRRDLSSFCDIEKNVDPHLTRIAANLNIRTSNVGQRHGTEDTVGARFRTEARQVGGELRRRMALFMGPGHARVLRYQARNDRQDPGARKIEPLLDQVMSR